MNPNTNYLKNTIPELEQEFVEIIRQIPVFGSLSRQLIHQLFQYSKFIKLNNGQYVIEQDKLDQEIFVLIQGYLHVMLNDEFDKAKLIDRINQPFTLFGEKSLLGEPRSASIVAVGEVILLGIDLSSLPDIVEGYEIPENRVADEEYLHNVSMYSLLGKVLAQRLDRLVKDQYKFIQKIKNFQDQHSMWVEEWFDARIFNQFMRNELPVTPRVPHIIREQLQNYEALHPNLEKMLNEPNINTSSIYAELVTLDAMGEIINFPSLLLPLMRKLSDHFKTHSQYADVFLIDLLEVHGMPLPMTALSKYLNLLYDALIQADVFSTLITKEEFCRMFFDQGNLEPFILAKNLWEERKINSRFNQAYLLFLVCQHCVYAISEMNTKILQYVEFLNTYSAPQQKFMNREQGLKWVERLCEMEEEQRKKNRIEGESENVSENVDDLLANMGL